MKKKGRRTQSGDAKKSNTVSLSATVSRNNVALSQHTDPPSKEQPQLDSRFFPLVLNVIDQCVFTVDCERRITYLNENAKKMTGYSEEEVLGRPCAEVFQTHLCHTSCPLHKAIENRKRVSGERVRLKIKDGRTLPVEVSAAALATDEGTLLGGVEVLRDMSHLERLRRQMEGRYCFEDIISKSPIMHRLFSILTLIADSESTVLITGASGTGKELVAKAIHHRGSRQNKPFIAVNCGAMPENLLESELFGYVRGAFTDARRDKPGRIAQADGGTLFLDEVGDLSQPLQVKFLRFLQDKVYEPLGATFSTRADIRIITATNQNLETMVREGSFREDLYYRLNVVELHLPNLEKRKEDIPLLVQHFIEHFAIITNKQIEEISPEALAAIVNHDFPGNVRELENMIERAFVLCVGNRIEFEHLPRVIREAVEGKQNKSPQVNPLENSERSTLLNTLQACGGNKTMAARKLGIHRSTLFRKLQKHGL